MEPNALRNTLFGMASLGVRTMRSRNSSLVMRYNNHDNNALRSAADGFFDHKLQLQWPRGAYDDWQMEQSTLERSLLSPHPGTFGSFSSRIDKFEAFHSN